MISVSKKYENGKHYYAYIGNMEVHNGNTLCFPTETAARNAAMEIIRNA